MVEHLFRHEAGKMVATLTRSSAWNTSVVPEALAWALRTWPFYGVPENPSVWVMRTSRNLALDVVRRVSEVFQARLRHLLRHSIAVILLGSDLGQIDQVRKFLGHCSSPPPKSTRKPAPRVWRRLEQLTETLDPESLRKYFTLTETDLQEVAVCHDVANELGFAVQLCTLRWQWLLV